MTTTTSPKKSAPKPAAKAAPKPAAKPADLAKVNQAKYRILVRLLAKEAGFTVAAKEGTDILKKGDVTIAIHHSNHIAVAAERTVGDQHEQAPKQGKWFTVQKWINGSDQPFKSQLAKLGDLAMGTGLAKV